jgi:hypothetical protein
VTLPVTDDDKRRAEQRWRESVARLRWYLAFWYLLAMADDDTPSARRFLRVVRQQVGGLVARFGADRARTDAARVVAEQAGLNYAQDVGVSVPRVPPAQVRSALDMAIEETERQATLRTPRADAVEAFEIGMRERIVDAHLMATAAAKGGFHALTPEDYFNVGNTVGTQYNYLAGLVADLRSGKQRVGRQLDNRVGLYFGLARGTYYQTLGGDQRARGFTTERNVITPGENCLGCLRETSRGQVPIGSLVPIGQRDCLGACRCEVRYA